MNSSAHAIKHIHLVSGASASLETLNSLAQGASLTLDAGHWEAVARCHQFLQQLINDRRRLYGITTGYGPLADTYVDPAASAQLQRGLVYHLSAGTGPLLNREQVRAIIAERAITLAQGHSAVHPETLARLLGCLTEDWLPEVPAMGTVGASGDLTPLAHIVLGLMGQGRVCVKGQSMPADEALALMNWQALDPEGKDALALVNGTSAMTAIAALNGCRAQRYLELSLQLTLLYGEIFQYQREALQPQLAQVRPHPGQIWAQTQLLSLSQDSQRLQDYASLPPVLPSDLPPAGARQHQPLPQAPYTFRCAPQHLGAVADSLSQHNAVVEREITAVTDNPVFFPDSQQVVHGGNFFGQHIAFATDHLNNALITLAVHSERRLARLTDPEQNGELPAFLRGNDNGLHSGFMGAQVTATALVAELRTHAQPASIQSIPTNANNQDVVTMGTIGARRTYDSLDRLSEILAIEAMALTQAYELKGGAPAGFSSSSRELAQWVRARTAALGDDRPLADDIQRLAKALRKRPLLEDANPAF